MGGGSATTPRGSPGSRTPARPSATPVGDVDLQALVAQAVSSLAEQTGCERVVAWACDARGAATVLAARFDGPQRVAPSREALEALAALPRATDLGAPGVPRVLAALAHERGLTLAAPIRAGVHGPVAYLLAGGARDPAGRVRPRALAALEAAARRLEVPAAAALAVARLASLDERVRHLDRLAALGDLAAELVHEIRNPLVSLKTFVQLLPERSGDPEFLQTFVGVARDELRRMERLLDSALGHARSGSERTTSEPSGGIAAAIDATRRLVSLRAAERRITLEVDRPSRLPAAAIADDGLRQVLLNLLLNALDATPGGGRVQLRVRALPDGIELEVADEGPGIAPAVRERVFEPFVTTRDGRGGGLGLAVSRRIVEEAGGTLELLDAPDGSVFRIVLPER